ncbi:hypothetical protein [Albirhodobacter sp. R86504]|jgi:hypothetical protein|uniref:hypothetical protein n=1 Tax=Albirhodobacter sp. R86504 TaxID=3093848 RepID=UPI003671ACFB
MLQMSRLRAGRWEGIVTSDAAPEIEVLHLDKPIGAPELEDMGKGRWRVSVMIPAALLSEGILSFIVFDKIAQDKIGEFIINAGLPVGEDLRAEVDLLRAELDLLKKAFRRHCVETGAQG